MSSRGFIRDSRTYPRSRDAVAHLSLTSGVKTSKPETSVGERCDEIQKTTHNSVAEASAYTNEYFVPEKPTQIRAPCGGRGWTKSKTNKANGCNVQSMSYANSVRMSWNRPDYGVLMEKTTVTLAFTLCSPGAVGVGAGARCAVTTMSYIGRGPSLAPSWMVRIGPSVTPAAPAYVWARAIASATAAARAFTRSAAVSRMTKPTELIWFEPAATRASSVAPSFLGSSSVIETWFETV